MTWSTVTEFIVFLLFTALVKLVSWLYSSNMWYSYRYMLKYTYKPVKSRDRVELCSIIQRLVLTSLCCSPSVAPAFTSRETTLVLPTLAAIISAESPLCVMTAYMLNSEPGIFYALAITSFFWICGTSMCGDAVVLVSNPSRGPMLLVCVILSFLSHIFPFFPFCQIYHIGVRVVQ